MKSEYCYWLSVVPDRDMMMFIHIIYLLVSIPFQYTGFGVVTMKLIIPSFLIKLIFN